MARNAITGLLALLILSACGGTGFPSAAPQKLRVSGGEVVIAGPKGYCIDTNASRDGKESAFVLLGSCAAISKLPFRPKPEIPAILMVTVSPDATTAPVSKSMKKLAAFFKSDAGRAALSRDGKAETVEVIEILGQGGIFYIHALDHSSGTLAGAGAEYWRALFDVQGHLVTASVLGLKERPIAARAGFQTLNAFTRRILAENAQSRPKSAPQ